jgi:hypothetical protein
MGELKMGKVVVNEAYLDLLKSGVKVEEQPLLRDKHLPTHLTEKPKSDSELRHRMITEELLDLYLKKNNDYGNSFDISLDEDGLLVAKIRLGDKSKRFESLLKKKQQEVADESMRDTLIDMANYAIMTVMWMDKQESAKEYTKPRTIGDGLDALQYAIKSMSQAAAGLDTDDKPYVGYKVDDVIAQFEKAKEEPGMAYVDIDWMLNEHRDGPSVNSAELGRILGEQLKKGFENGVKKGGL